MRPRDPLDLLEDRANALRTNVQIAPALIARGVERYRSDRIELERAVSQDISDLIFGKGVKYRASVMC